MSTEALVIRNFGPLQFGLTSEAIRIRDAALEQSALVGCVKNAEQNEVAVAAQKELKRVAKLVEDCRKEAKAPLLDCGRLIDQSCKAFCAEVETELTRIGQLTADWAQLQLAAQRSAEAARSNTISEIEREREEALAKAETVEERDRIAQEFGERIAALEPPVVESNRADGQIVREEWEFEVYDIAILLKHFPDCVKVEPRKREIKEKLALGYKLPGVRAWKAVKAGVRLAPDRKEIEV